VAGATAEVGARQRRCVGGGEEKWAAELSELFARVGHRFSRVDLRRRVRACALGCWAAGRKNAPAEPGLLKHNGIR
jgi:hypothetical protein